MNIFYSICDVYICVSNTNLDTCLHGEKHFPKSNLLARKIFNKIHKKDIEQLLNPSGIFWSILPDPYPGFELFPEPG